MKSGLLWFDSSAKPINEKILDAARRFEQKFGVRPNRAYINARDMLSDSRSTGSNGDNLPVIGTLDGMEVESKMTIHPNHVWIGVHHEIISLTEETEQTDAVTAGKRVGEATA